MKIGLFALVGLLSMLWAGSAQANTTVSNTTGTLEITASGFTHNDVSINYVSTDAFTGQIHVTDRDDTIAPGTGCQLVSSATVSCPSGGVSSIKATLGELDDQIVNNTNRRSTLDGGAGDDTLTGGINDDRLIGGTGADALNGGGGDDTADYNARKAGVSVSLDDGLANDGELGEGDNVRWDVENASGGGGNDVLTGNAAANGLYGGGGVDTLWGNAGNDTLSGGPGGDTYIGGDGDDRFWNEDAPDGSDKFHGGLGYDWVSYDRRYAVTVDIDGVADDGGEYGEADNVNTDVEHVSGGWHHNTLTGSAAADELDGGDGPDTINGLGGDDELTGNEGADILNGGDGNDTFVGRGYGTDPDGADTFNGGLGSDSVSYVARTVRVVVDEDGVADDGTAGEGDNVKADVEYVTGGSAADALTGGSATNHLYGGPGDDELDGLGGADWVYGDSGADSIIGGSGDDRLHGGAGNDDLSGFDGMQHNDTLDGEANVDSCASDQQDSQTSCEDSSQSLL